MAQRDDTDREIFFTSALVVIECEQRRDRTRPEAYHRIFEAPLVQRAQMFLDLMPERPHRVHVW